MYRTGCCSVEFDSTTRSTKRRLFRTLEAPLVVASQLTICFALTADDWQFLVLADRQLKVGNLGAPCIGARLMDLLPIIFG
jgi:hypothetical protein